MNPQDHFEIQQLYAAYCHRMDSGDAEGWADLFTHDGAWERVDEPAGEPVFSVRGHAEIAAFAREDYAERGRGLQRHWMGNILLDGEPPNVHAHTYGFLIRSVDGAIQWLAHGNFEDDLVKTDDGWRFARRALHLLDPSPVPSET